MFGLRYNLVCPKCKEIFEANHAGTSYYRIRGRPDDVEYIEEQCSECGYKYYRACIDYNECGDDFKYQGQGLSVDEIRSLLIGDLLKMRRASGVLTPRIHSGELESLSKRARIVSEMEDEDCIIPVSSVKKEDIEVKDVVFW